MYVFPQSVLVTSEWRRQGGWWYGVGHGSHSQDEALRHRGEHRRRARSRLATLRRVAGRPMKSRLKMHLRRRFAIL
ncbi:jg25799 [Pararge aegeria aegeria]|uniref:Jg25799 protein n=1 Tax=Pararge aegeria aegeria TaxID=348720 RepID=A0A8S4QSY9_9NEOP|nr:jg25799 [Pararge aegeria aegeria]